jgi:hypothetical protein
MGENGSEEKKEERDRQSESERKDLTEEDEKEPGHRVEGKEGREQNERNDRKDSNREGKAVGPPEIKERPREAKDPLPSSDTKEHRDRGNHEWLTQCTICTENYSFMRQRAKLLPCRHDEWCAECAEKWIGRSSVCPKCRKDVTHLSIGGDDDDAIPIEQARQPIPSSHQEMSVAQLEAIQRSLPPMPSSAPRASLAHLRNFTSGSLSPRRLVPLRLSAAKSLTIPWAFGVS